MVKELSSCGKDKEQWCWRGWWVVGLNDARGREGAPPFASCNLTGDLVEHARVMAEAGTVWHSGYDSIVGFAWDVPSLVQAFMASPPHHDLIMAGGRPADAEVGCYWRRDGSVNSLYCAGRFRQ